MPSPSHSSRLYHPHNISVTNGKFPLALHGAKKFGSMDVWGFEPGVVRSLGPKTSAAWEGVRERESNCSAYWFATLHTVVHSATLCRRNLSADIPHHEISMLKNARNRASINVQLILHEFSGHSAVSDYSPRNFAVVSGLRVVDSRPQRTVP